MFSVKGSRKVNYVVALGMDLYILNMQAENVFYNILLKLGGHLHFRENTTWR